MRSGVELAAAPTPGRIRCGVYLDDGSAEIKVTDNYLVAPVASAPGVRGLALKGCSTLEVATTRRSIRAGEALPAGDGLVRA